MGETIPPESKDQLASDRDDDYAHEAVTIAPPAPHFEDLLRQPTPMPSLSVPLPNRSDQHFRAALDAGTRAGSSLTELSKIVAELSGGLSGAKLANEQLVQELSTLRAMLGSANEQQLALKHRQALLEQELTQAKTDAERERDFLTAQHDDFIAALIEEHEDTLRTQSDEGDTRRMDAQVSDLAQKLVQTEAARLQADAEQAHAREALAKVQAQRDEAQTRAEKRERERDELRAEASQLRARLGTHRSPSTAPPPPVSVRPPSFRPPPALLLDAGELDSTLHTRSSSPRLPSVRPRLTPPPELQGAVYTPRELTPPSGSSATARTARPPIPRALTPLGARLSSSLKPAPSSSSFKAASSASLVEPPTSSTKTAPEFPRESTRPGVGGPKPSSPPAPADFGPPPSGWTPVPPALEPAPEPTPAASPTRPAVVSAASMPPGIPSMRPILKQKPDPTTRPLIDYSLGGDGLPSETLEGVRLSSKPPRK